METGFYKLPDLLTAFLFLMAFTALLTGSTLLVGLLLPSGPWRLRLSNPRLPQLALETCLMFVVTTLASVVIGGSWRPDNDWVIVGLVFAPGIVPPIWAGLRATPKSGKPAPFSRVIDYLGDSLATAVIFFILLAATGRMYNDYFYAPCGHPPPPPCMAEGPGFGDVALAIAILGALLFVPVMTLTGVLKEGGLKGRRVGQTP